jgi:hypothetical protein
MRRRLPERPARRQPGFEAAPGMRQQMASTNGAIREVWANPPERAPVCYITASASSPPALRHPRPDPRATRTPWPRSRSTRTPCCSPSPTGAAACPRATGPPRAAVEALAEAVGQAGEADPVSVVLAGFDRANAAVADLRLGSGSTLTAVLIDGPTARVFHAGDSPAAVIGQRGAVRFATLAHSPVGFGVEAGILSHEEAENHADSGVVLNVLGFAEMFVHVGPPVRLRPMDTVVVASDALTDNLTMGRITEISRRGRAVRALQALIDETMHVMSDPAVGHADDLSLLLYRPTRRKGE